VPELRAGLAVGKEIARQLVAAGMIVLIGSRVHVGR
jgi:hypothetical protein